MATEPTELSAQNAESLQDEIRETFESYNWGTARWSVLVYSLDSGETIFSIDPASAIAPASNIKLLTTAAALQRLGPDYRFRTYLLSSAPVKNGVLQGDLTLYGTGDPGLSDRFYGSKDEVFQLLVDDLQAAGVTEVSGDLIADASFFPGPLRDEGWEQRDLNEHFTAPISALSYNENVVSFRIRPGSVGAPPNVETIPAHSALNVENTATTVANRARPRLAILREDPLKPVRITGRMSSSSRDVWRQMTVAVPADFAGASFRAVLEDRGIPVTGSTRRVELPVESVVRRLSGPALGKPAARILARHTSRPLAEYLEIVNKESNNLFAELIFRAIGRAASGIGSPSASALAVRETLVTLGVDTEGLFQVDGSGLSGENRVSAASFVDLIRRISEGSMWPDYWASLPRAGTSYELGRMYQTAAANNLRAKTGTIDGVSALTGMVRTQDGERLAFSLMVNGPPSIGGAKQLENEIGVQLAEFQRAPGTAPDVTEQTPNPAGNSTTAFSERHRVARGENLGGIAISYGVTVNEILQANPRIERNRIIAGQWLEIPKHRGN
tara:strand:+ start:4378 stop:6048 length:1671 start_codon:yes stop_codon:yes gene_type:complete